MKFLCKLFNVAEYVFTQHIVFCFSLALVKYILFEKLFLYFYLKRVCSFVKDVAKVF